MRRLTVVVIGVFLFAAAFAYLDRVYSQKFLDTTGRAQWIWAQHRMSSNEPVAFFATRDFELPERRHFAHLKIFGDPEYTVWINGAEVARRSVGEERSLALYDLSDRVRTGRNRIVVAVRAGQGVGGLLAALDIGPEALNWIVSDSQWRIHRRWTAALPRREPQSASSEPPLLVGEPPLGRWNYLDVESRALSKPAGSIQRPIRSFQLIGSIPTISTLRGVAVAGIERHRAVAYDFGPTTGRVRIVLDADAATSRAILVRLANHADELPRAEQNLRRVVFAPGETAVTLIDPASFRYVMVFAQGARAEVVHEAVAQ